MGTKIATKKPAAMIELYEIILRVWFPDIGQDYIQKLISSTSYHCKVVIAAHGGSTKY